MIKQAMSCDVCGKVQVLTDPEWDRVRYESPIPDGWIRITVAPTAQKHTISGMVLRGHALVAPNLPRAAASIGVNNPKRFSFSDEPMLAAREDLDVCSVSCATNRLYSYVTDSNE